MGRLIVLHYSVLIPVPVQISLRQRTAAFWRALPSSMQPKPLLWILAYDIFDDSVELCGRVHHIIPPATAAVNSQRLFHDRAIFTGRTRCLAHEEDGDNRSASRPRQTSQGRGCGCRPPQKWHGYSLWVMLVKCECHNLIAAQRFDYRGGAAGSRP